MLTVRRYRVPVLAVVAFLRQATKVLIQCVFSLEGFILQISEDGPLHLHTDYLCKQVMAIYRRETKAAFP